MATFQYTITDPEGLHARPAGTLTKFVQTFHSQVSVSKAGKKADGKRIFAIMGLAVKCGDTIVFELEGENETEEAEKLQKFCRENL